MDITAKEKKQFEKDGFIIVRGLFSKEEIESLNKKVRNDHQMEQAAALKDDGKGNSMRLTIWNQPGDGLYGMFSRCKKLVNKVEALLGGEVYHYHSKMSLKDAKVGGAFSWHQDYGYWYQHNLLFPDLCSVMIAVDKATKENGCLQVIRGSQKMGRVNHTLKGDQAGADMERVKEVSKIREKEYCEMDPGDALFFHCNLLHSSAPNKSENPRWAMICAYNKATNNPYKESYHSSYIKLQKVEDDMILKVASGGNEKEVEFLDMNKKENTAKGLELKEES
jgi:hypothetical protein